MIGFALIGLLELVALARYPDAVAWSAPEAWAWSGLQISFLLVGVDGELLAWRAGPAAAVES